MEKLSNKDLPRICYVLGGEKTPLKIGEEFEFLGDKYEIGGNGIFYETNSGILAPYFKMIKMINHPEKIVRQLQFSEDEKAFMRLLVKAGFPWIARDKTRSIEAYQEKPGIDSNTWFFTSGSDNELPIKLFPQITFENSPVNCLDYVSES